MLLFSRIIGFFVVAPIGWYLQYKILILVEATELMWFLFYVWVPAAFFFGFMNVLFDDKRK